VAPYSVRAHPGAGVSTPLAWEEVNVALAPARWTLRSTPERFERIGDPMRPMLDARPDLAAALVRLGELVKGT
jgi:bifunctional non-homologous end joining protein LigD